VQSNGRKYRIYADCAVHKVQAFRNSSLQSMHAQRNTAGYYWSMDHNKSFRLAVLRDFFKS